jgi:hypothetical protein
MQAAWERVEAKLDRLGEVQAEQGRALAQLDRRLGRVEGDLDLVKLMLEAVRHEIERRAERLKDELLTALGRETRVELLAAQGLNDDHLGALERRVLALEGGG